MRVLRKVDISGSRKITSLHQRKKINTPLPLTFSSSVKAPFDDASSNYREVLHLKQLVTNILNYLKSAELRCYKIRITTINVCMYNFLEPRLYMNY